MRHCDICVIGAGPAGLMAAGRAAEYAGQNGGEVSLSILILDGNPEPGRKLLITGGGRCNITNVISDPRELSQRYGREGRALISPFTRMSPEDSLAFFNSLNLPTKVEAENRAFPRDDSSRSVLDALLRFCRRGGVEILLSMRVTEVEIRTDGGFILQTNRGTVSARKLIMATGGYARPDTGSDGSGFDLAGSLGHEIRSPDAILVPVEVREKAVSSIMGYSIQDCGIRVLLQPGQGSPDHEKVLERSRGKVLFTHFGLSGPGVLNLSARIGELEGEYRRDLSSGSRLIIELNPLPGTSGEEVECRIRNICAEHPKKSLKNALEGIIQKRFHPFLEPELLSALDGRAGELSKALRRRLSAAARGIRLTYRRRKPPEDAIVARGGIPIDEVDFRRMESKKTPGLYIVGDMLDVNRPSGGFSLQLCWSSGWVAGEAAADSVL